jgi:hypothetical protein
VRIERAGQSRDPGAQREQRDLDPFRIASERCEGLLVVPHGADGAAVVAMRDPAHQQHDSNRHGHHQSHIGLAPERRHQECGNARHAAGPTREAQVLDQLDHAELEADARDQQIVAGDAQGRQRHGNGERHGQQSANQHAQRHRQAEIAGQ